MYVYITNDEKVFIAGNQDGHVHVFDKDGNFQKKFKPPIAGLLGVCGKDDRVYVARYSASKIYEYTIDGKLIRKKLSITQSVGVGDSNGNFYISQQGTRKIYVYNPDGSKYCEIFGIDSNPCKI